MRIAIISDTHGFHREIRFTQTADVLVHCGDATMLGEMSITEDLAEWFKYLKDSGQFKHILFVPGNHDFNFDISAGRYNSHGQEQLAAAGVMVLIDRAVTLFPADSDRAVKFYGAPWVPNLPGWAFYDHGKDKFAVAPSDVNVLITHSPAFGTLDRLMNGEHVGSTHLLDYTRRCPNLILHAHGHIHEDRGTRGDFHRLLDPEPRVFVSVNAAICDRMYRPIGLPYYLNTGRVDVEELR